MRFASADAAMRALFAEFGPVDDPDWRFMSIFAAEPIDPDHPDIRTARGAISRTMHFGSARLDLTTGVVEFIDEDHRDGGEFVVRRVSLSREWCEALSVLDWQRA
ncbi:MAG: hypothetical protein KF889_09835 [Alphaproteobacteria bacterium]|nr:hypothetical protein [Alphaproteobacteria bacterium]MCW5741121.1 hypothetical protein [Alphaproteobacteria bacterium]